MVSCPDAEHLRLRPAVTLTGTMQLIIVGLRRSGTTAFWRPFRQDDRMVAYDEPFNPNLIQLPNEHPKAIRSEFMNLHHRDPRLFWRTFAPIGLTEELMDGLTERQTAYIEFLGRSAGGSFVLDTTRCHFKIKHLAEAFPEAVLVHLFREPVAFVSSHLLPTGSEQGRAGRAALLARRTIRRVGFWSVAAGYDNWGLESLIGNHSDSMFGIRLRERGIRPETVFALPAAGRLLAFWRLAFETAQAAGADEFRDRFLSIPFERFAENPGRTLHTVYSKTGLGPPQFDNDVGAPNPGFRAKDRRWSEMAEAVGIEQTTGFDLLSL